MVELKAVRSSNATLQALPPGLVAVFAGATAGIGLATLQQLAKYANAPRAYIIGRSKDRAAHFIDKLKAINPMGTFIFIEGQFSLIADIDRMCDMIKEYEDHIDLVCMSPGYLSVSGRHETSEGVETDLSLQYYARLRLVVNLMPMLERSLSPRVISILVAGFEGPVDTDDLERRNHYNFMKATWGAATMTDFAFEELAKRHPTVTFIHSYPGKVGTNIVDDLLSSLPGVLWYCAQIPRYTILPMYNKFIAMSPEEAGERTLFLATSACYPPAIDHPGDGRGGLTGWVERPELVGCKRPTIMDSGKGNGVYRVTWNGEVCNESKMLDTYREEELGKTIFDHTMGVFERALARSRGLVTPLPFSKESFFGYIDDSDFLDFEVEL